MGKDEVGVEYQRAGQVRQLLAERANAEAYGQSDRVAAVDKQLAELGVSASAPKVERSSPPAGRGAKQERAQTTAAEKPADVADGKAS